MKKASEIFDESLKHTFDKCSEQTAPLDSLVRFVFAGTYRQAERYATEMGWQKHEWRYLSSVETIMGIRAIELHKTGTWYERKDAGNIQNVLATMIKPNDKVTGG